MWPITYLIYVEILLQVDVTYKEQLVEILAKEPRILHSKEILMIKISWENLSKQEAT